MCEYYSIVCWVSELSTHSPKTVAILLFKTCCCLFTSYYLVLLVIFQRHLTFFSAAFPFISHLSTDASEKERDRQSKICWLFDCCNRDLLSLPNPTYNSRMDYWHKNYQTQFITTHREYTRTLCCFSSWLTQSLVLSFSFGLSLWTKQQKMYWTCIFAIIWLENYFVFAVSNWKWVYGNYLASFVSCRMVLLQIDDIPFDAKMNGGYLKAISLTSFEFKHIWRIALIPTHAIFFHEKHVKRAEHYISR